MNFDNCIYLCKDNPNKDIKNVYYSKKSFCGPFSQFPFPPAKTNFVHLYKKNRMTIPLRPLLELKSF